MLSFDAFHNIDFPYQLLPDQARRVALASIEQQGFTPLEHYNIFSLGINSAVKANILAFAHPVHRTPEYTGLTVFNAPNDFDDGNLVSLLATSGAPFHLIHKKDEFSFWAYPIVNKPRIIENHISYEQLGGFLKRHEADINPQTIVKVKQGNGTFTIFRDVQLLQLSFWVADVTGKRLVDHFGSAVASLRHDINRRGDILEADKDLLVTRLAIQLLGAMILGDTGVLNQEIRLNRPSLDVLMSKAHEKFGRYFQYNIFTEYYKEAENAYQVLQQICYAGFMPDMLKELYKTAYTKEERKSFGSYDTPLHLTRRIWKNIPVEYLAPQKRMIADMTCGWGSFLVAGHERLSGLNDMEGVSLRNHLYGNDSVAFTSHLAGLGLLLATSEDSWSIDQGNALEWPWLNAHQPTVIVGNPPFEANRKRIDVSSDQRREKANQFLAYAINRLAPGGYLAMVMPRSFIAAEASYNLRKYFLSMCDLLELWELPYKAFSDAVTQTIVLFAQKHEKSPRSMVRIRTIQPSSYDAFHYSKDLIVTTSGLVASQSMWNEQKRKSENSENTHIMDYKLILSENDWAALTSHCVDLQEFVNCFRGVTRGSSAAEKREKIKTTSKEVKCLFQARKVLKRPFFIDYQEAITITYPDDLQWAREQYEHVFEGPKVILTYVQHPRWGRKAKVAIERRGFYVSDNFWVLELMENAVEKNVTVEVLAAIVSWDVSNAWIIEHLSSPSISKRTVNTIPFPRDLSIYDYSMLEQAVLSIEEAAYADLPEPVEATQTIDTILKRAYHIDDVTFNRLRQVKEWDSSDQITLDPPPDSINANWHLSGIVDAVDAEKGTITFRLSGFDDLQEIRIAPSMPGWLLRPYAAFYTKIPRRYIKNGIIDFDTTDWGIFYPQHYTYMTEEELFAGLADVLHEDDKHRV